MIFRFMGFPARSEHSKPSKSRHGPKVLFFVLFAICGSPISEILCNSNSSLMAACGFCAKGPKSGLNGIISPSSDGVRQSFYMENVGMVVAFHFHPTRAQTDASARRNHQPANFLQKWPNRRSELSGPALSSRGVNEYISRSSGRWRPPMSRESVTAFFILVIIFVFLSSNPS